MPTGIAIDSGGHLLVGDSCNHRMLRFRGWQVDGELVVGGSCCCDTLNQLDEPMCVAIDSCGHLSVAATCDGRVLRFRVGQVDGEQLVARGTGTGGALNQLDESHGIAIDSVRHLLVADSASDSDVSTETSSP